MATYSTRKVESTILENLVGYNLRRGYTIAAQLFSDTFAEQAITPIQFAIMNVILVDHQLSQKEIAANIGSSPQVIVSLVKDLEQRRLVTRVRSEQDRRHHHLKLTDSGQQLIHTINDKISDVEAHLLKNFSDDEKTVLLGLLTKLVHEHSVFS